MEREVYKTFAFENEPVWDDVPEGKLGYSNWDSKAEYDTFFKMCFVKNKGICLRMHTNEISLRAVNKNRDENMWEDSCMEFFLCPFEGRKEYLNFEMNPNGAYLCQFGEERENRVFIKSLTDCEADITAQVCENGWSVELFVPVSLVSEAFNESFKAGPCTLKGNFYKCGDLTEKPHYGSFSKMTTLPPGFHNPECFAEIRIIER